MNILIDTSRFDGQPPLTANVERYCLLPCGYGLQKYRHGSWVLHDDYQKLKEENAQLRELLVSVTQTAFD